MESMLRFAILFATILTAAALFWPALQQAAGFGELPGDVVVDFRGLHLYLPLGVAGAVSLILAGLSRLLGR